MGIVMLIAGFWFQDCRRAFSKMWVPDVYERSAPTPITAFSFGSQLKRPGLRSSCASFILLLSFRRR